VEIKFDGAADVVFKYAQVRFDLSEQSIKESDTDVALSLVGHVYGTVTIATDFTSGTTIRA